MPSVPPQLSYNPRCPWTQGTIETTQAVRSNMSAIRDCVKLTSRVERAWLMQMQQTAKAINAAAGLAYMYSYLSAVVSWMAPHNVRVLNGDGDWVTFWEVIKVACRETGGGGDSSFYCSTDDVVRNTSSRPNVFDGVVMETHPPRACSSSARRSLSSDSIVQCDMIVLCKLPVWFST